MPLPWITSEQMSRNTRPHHHRAVPFFSAAIAIAEADGREAKWSPGTIMPDALLVAVGSVIGFSRGERLSAKKGEHIQNHPRSLEPRNSLMGVHSSETSEGKGATGEPNDK